LVPHVIFNEIVMLLFQIVNMKPEMQFRPNIKHLKFLRYRNTVSQFWPELCFEQKHCL
jgi:hypothetical protein